MQRARHMQIRAAAACVVCVVLAAAAAVAGLQLLRRHPQLQLAALATALAAEAAFVAYYWLVLIRDFNHIPEQHAPADLDSKATTAAFLRHMSRVDDFCEYLTAWFLDAPFDSIRLDNVKEMYAYAIHYKTLDQMREEGSEHELDELLEQLQEMHSIRIPPGYNPQLRFMQHLWDEVPHIYRPLFFYLAMELLELLCWAMLAAAGFTRHTQGRCVYFTLGLGPPGAAAEAAPAEAAAAPAAPQQEQQPQQRRQRRRQRRHSKHAAKQQHDVEAAVAAGPQQQHAGGAAASGQGQEQRQQAAAAGGAPIVLLHGVGAGLLPYLQVIFMLAATGRPLVLPVWKHVSMRLTKHIPSVDEAMQLSADILAAHGVSRAAFVAHSYGTCIAARVVKAKPHLISSLVLIDPVCFAMFQPHLLKFFLFTTHASNNAVVNFFMALLSSEIHCARNFCRNFFWSSINLWEEQSLPGRTLVVLSGNDLLCPTLHVRSWLEQHTTARVLFHDTAAHGAGLIMCPSWQRVIIDSIGQLLLEEQEGPAPAAGCQQACAGSSCQAAEAAGAAAAVAVAVPATAAGIIPGRAEVAPAASSSSSSGLAGPGPEGCEAEAAAADGSGGLWSSLPGPVSLSSVTGSLSSMTGSLSSSVSGGLSSVGVSISSAVDGVVAGWPAGLPWPDFASVSVPLLTASVTAGVGSTAAALGSVWDAGWSSSRDYVGGLSSGWGSGWGADDGSWDAVVQAAVVQQQEEVQAPGKAGGKGVCHRRRRGSGGSNSRAAAAAAAAAAGYDSCERPVAVSCR